MNVLDFICIAVIAVAAIRCAFRGFITEILSMAAVILGIVGAIFFSRAGAVLIENYLGETAWNQIIAFLAIFVLVYLVVKLVERALHSILERIRLERLDRTLGLLLGVVEGAIVVSLIVYLLRVQPVFDVDALLDGSYFAGLVLELVPIFAPEASSVQPANG